MPGCSLPEGGEMSSDAIRITKTANKKQRPKDKDLAFGTVFTDHMFVVDFQEEKGWYDPRVEPYAPLSLDPATAVLHYGQSLFEGLKAFRGTDGTIRLFRPQKHVERLNRTAKRMTIPQLDPDLILRSWTTLVDVDRDWVPALAGTILAGVTRDTALTLMRAWGLRVSERQITIDEVIAAAHKGALKEVWATGTAAVISPVGELAYKGERIVVNGGRIGELSQKLYDTIVGIQYGTAPDTHGWTLAV